MSHLKSVLHTFSATGLGPAPMQNQFAPAILLAAIVSVVSNITAADDKPQFKITTKRDSDKVEVKVEKSRTTFSVHSPLGISHAQIERLEDKWPEAVLLKLHLQGLERLQVSNGSVTLTASISSHDSKTRLWKDSDEKSLLDSKSPYWMDIRMVGDDGKPVKAIPLKDGYFEMMLPQAIFENNPKSITLDWIDFYRD